MYIKLHIQTGNPLTDIKNGTVPTIVDHLALASQSDNDTFYAFFVLTAIFTLVLVVRELLQIIYSIKIYLKEKENALDVILIALNIGKPPRI